MPHIVVAQDPDHVMSHFPAGPCKFLHFTQISFSYFLNR